MLKTLLMIAGGNIGKLVAMSSISIMEAVFGSVPFLVLYFVLSAMIDGRFNHVMFGNMMLIVVISALLRALFSFLNVIVSRKLGTLMIRDLRLRLGEHIRKLSLGFFNLHDVGALSNRILDNVNRMEMIVTMLIPEMVSTMVLSVLVAAGLFFIDPRLAAATIVTMPAALAVMVWARNIMAKQGRALVRSNERLADSLIEFVEGIKYLKSFNNSRRKFDALVERMDDFRDKSLKTEGRLSPVMALAGIVIDLGLVFLILCSAFLLAGGGLGGKTILIFIIISSRFFENLKVLSVNYIKVKYLGIAGMQIRELFDEPLLKGTGREGRFNRFDIEFKDVEFSYNRKRVLNRINLEIGEKSLTAFVGPSGSGKTTMTNLIARFFDLDSGEIRIGGTNISSCDSESVLKIVSMVFQDVILFNDTIYNNLRIGRHDATREEVISAAERANCHDFISRLPEGYDTIVGENGANLSGGEQQRISIARALLKDAPIVLLDEATASLDPENEIFIQNAISELVKDKTVIVIAHRLKTIKSADKIVVFENGRILEEGRHEELLEDDGLYTRMWAAQERSSEWRAVNQSSSVQQLA